MTQDADDIAGVIAPPPLIALATILLGLAADWLFPVFVLKTLLTFYVRVAIGVALVAAGAALALAAERKFKQAGTNVMPWKPSLALATAGSQRAASLKTTRCGGIQRQRIASSSLNKCQMLRAGCALGWARYPGSVRSSS